MFCSEGVLFFNYDMFDLGMAAMLSCFSLRHWTCKILKISSRMELNSNSTFVKNFFLQCANSDHDSKHNGLDVFGLNLKGSKLYL